MKDGDLGYISEIESEIADDEESIVLLPDGREYHTEKCKCENCVAGPIMPAEREA